MSKRYAPPSLAARASDFRAVHYSSKDSEEIRKEAFSRLASLGKTEITIIEFAYVAGEGYHTASKNVEKMGLTKHKGGTQLPIDKVVEFFQKHQYGAGGRQGLPGWRERPN